MQDINKVTYERACRVLPGGVNSPVRAFKSVQAAPIFIKSAKGSKVADIGGKEYIDFISSWGPLILGHAHPEIVEALKNAAEMGTSYGISTPAEIEIAELITGAIPSVEKVRMVNSGTEAAMSAIRLARGITGKDMIVKFGGCYHGHADSFLIKAGSGAMTFGFPDSPGVTKETAKNTLTAEFNDIGTVEALFEQYGDNIAALIVEPVAGNMGVIPPKPGFLEGLREITRKNNALLIFDEVITGFRLGTGGAQQRFNVMPDITVLGKIIGGGLPVGAYGGSKEIMHHIAPEGPVYQAGTLSGNPLAMAAGKTMLKILLENPDIYDNLEQKALKTADNLRQALQDSGINGVINRVGSMMTLFFTDLPEVETYQHANQSNTEMYAACFRYLLDNGILIAPSQFECLFISDAHTDEDLEKVAAICTKAFNSFKEL